MREARPSEAGMGEADAARSTPAGPPTPVSVVAGIGWPALPADAAAVKLAMLRALCESERLAPQALAERRRAQLALLLAHAREHVPWYRDRLPEGGDFPAGAPLLTRREVLAAGERLHARRLPAGHRVVCETVTSGSTGTPVRTLGTNVTQLLWDVLTLREHVWHGRDPRGTLAAIRNFPDGSAPYPEGASAPGWGRATDGVWHTGPAVMLESSASPEQQAEWLQRTRPHYLLSFPSVVRALARHCLDAGVALPGLREVRTLGEAVDPNLRALCREAWDAPLTDVYSSQEAGYLAFQCPAGTRYHALADCALIEVLDDAGRACAPGEVGRVVVTTPHNFAMPLIRYDTGDRAEAGPAAHGPAGECACGRRLPAIERILGRVRNLLTLPSGARVWPRLSEARYREVAPVRQFQVVQKRIDLLEVRLVVERPVTAGEEARLRELINARIGHRFEIRFRYPERIARRPGGKFEDFVSEL